MEGSTEFHSEVDEIRSKAGDRKRILSRMVDAFR